ncbi:MAG: hypothetical protein QXL27_07485 [Candidatus Bathyarchaeia archaeon]
MKFKGFYMKILQVTPYFPPAYAFGGPVKVAYQILRELISRVMKLLCTQPMLRLSFKAKTNPESVKGIKVQYSRNISLTSVRKLNSS